MTSQNEIFYVRISDSKKVRKTLLEASREIILILQRYEMFKRLREAKLELMEDLSNQFKEIHEITSKMKIEMPKVKFAHQAKTKNIKPAQEKEVIPKAKAPRAKKHNLEKEEEAELKRLEVAINEIEKRLEKMN
ncbi:hypothetical protein JXB31_02295 [Candidatus Woesearchaeota archaeon]|nr:hypothetical protein [Candidatus Woesearchaeota archaeon]